jgi:hypothetical protein
MDGTRSTAHNNDATALLRVESARDSGLPHKVVVFLSVLRVGCNVNLSILDVSFERVDSIQGRGILYISGASIETCTVPESPC